MIARGTSLRNDHTNCCESVLFALNPYLPADADVIPRISTAIGAGVSLNGLLCGCVSSVAQAIGLKYGRHSPEENPQPTWVLTDHYVTSSGSRSAP